MKKNAKQLKVLSEQQLKAIVGGAWGASTR